MKYLSVFLFALHAFFGFKDLSASEPLDYLTYSWNGNEEDLYLNIKIENRLEFSDQYTTIKTKNGQGIGCEIVCKPVLGSPILSSEGHELQEIKFTVILNNIHNPNQVFSTITKKTFYKGVNEKGQPVSKTSESKKESTLNNPAIDFTQRPVFSTINDSSNEGVISFKNSFPYSQITTPHQ